MGRLENEKGFDIFKSLAEENRDLEFYAAGVGGEGDVPQNLRCLGYMNSKVFLSMLDLLVVPSRWNEPFGRVVIEALALNIPVIVSRMGGLSELVSERYTIDVDNFIYSFRDVVNDIEVNGYRVEVLENVKSYSRLISDEYDGR